MEARKIIITGGATRVGAAIAEKLSGPNVEITIHFHRSKLKAQNLKKHLKALDKKMKEAASNLEFEEAAKIRDEIRKLESTELEITLNPKIRQYDVKNKLYPKGRSTMGMPGTKVTKKRDKKWKHGK